MKLRELRQIIREVLQEEMEVISSGDVNNLLKQVDAAVKAGKEVTVDGVKISKVVIPAGALFPADGGPSLRIKNFISTPEKIVIDGVPASQFKKTTGITPRAGSGLPSGATPMGYGGKGAGKFGQFYSGD